MNAPDQHELGKARGKGQKSAHDDHQFLKVAWHFERYHEQRQCKSKDDITKRFKPRDLSPAPVEILLRPQAGMSCLNCVVR